MAMHSHACCSTVHKTLFVTFAYLPILQPINEQLEKLPENSYYNVDEDKLFSVSFYFCNPHMHMHCFAT